MQINRNCALKFAEKCHTKGCVNLFSYRKSTIQIHGMNLMTERESKRSQSKLGEGASEDVSELSAIIFTSV